MQIHRQISFVNFSRKTHFASKIIYEKISVIMFFLLFLIARPRANLYFINIIKKIEIKFRIVSLNNLIDLICSILNFFINVHITFLISFFVSNYLKKESNIFMCPYFLMKSLLRLKYISFS